MILDMDLCEVMCQTISWLGAGNSSSPRWLSKGGKVDMTVLTGNQMKRTVTLNKIISLELNIVGNI